MSHRWMASYACPHCGVTHGTAAPMCADRDRWTDQERDQFRHLARKHMPQLRFADSTAQIAARLGRFSQR